MQYTEMHEAFPKWLVSGLPLYMQADKVQVGADLQLPHLHLYITKTLTLNSAPHHACILKGAIDEASMLQ